MDQIEDLQGRIVSAMQRIGAGLETLGRHQHAEPDLAEALEEERLANAQLQERILSLKSRHAEELEVLKSEIAQQSEVTLRLDSELNALRAANKQLRDSNATLREANAEGVGQPDLINASMLAELDALRADRAAETAEAGAILSRLQPLLVAAKETLNDAAFEEQES